MVSATYFYPVRQTSVYTDVRVCMRVHVTGTDGEREQVCKLDTCFITVLSFSLIDWLSKQITTLVQRPILEMSKLRPSEAWG